MLKTTVFFNLKIWFFKKSFPSFHYFNTLKRVFTIMCTFMRLWYPKTESTGLCSYEEHLFINFELFYAKLFQSHSLISTSSSVVIYDSYSQSIEICLRSVSNRDCEDCLSYQHSHCDGRFEIGVLTHQHISISFCKLFTTFELSKNSTVCSLSTIIANCGVFYTYWGPYNYWYLVFACQCDVEFPLQLPIIYAIPRPFCWHLSVHFVKVHFDWCCQHKRKLYQSMFFCNLIFKLNAKFF